MIPLASADARFQVLVAAGQSGAARSWVGEELGEKLATTIRSPRWANDQVGGEKVRWAPGGARAHEGRRARRCSRARNSRWQGPYGGSDAGNLCSDARLEVCPGEVIWIQKFRCIAVSLPSYHAVPIRSICCVSLRFDKGNYVHLFVLQFVRKSYNVLHLVTEGVGLIIFTYSY